MKLHTIKWAKPLDASRVQLFFDDDPNGPVIDLAPLLAQGGVFDAVRQHFAAAAVTPDGRSLYWRTGEGEDDVVDLCADALWLMAHPEDRAAAMTAPHD
jgi:hypothetical protein